MANIRLIKGRIKSAKNIAQITKAMELVAASKMRKAQAQAVSGKLYANKIYEMVMRLSSKANAVHHPLLTKPALITGKRLIVVISTNKGLCGGLNANLFRFIARAYEQKFSQHALLVYGRKASDFFTRFGGTIIADFSQTVPFTKTVPALVELITREFLSGRVDGVDIVYNDFVSVLVQTPKKKTVLPLTIDSSAVEHETHVGPEDTALDFTIEPGVKEVFDLLIPHYLENQIRDALLQAEASEHSARMIAMRSATDNASSLVEEYTLIYNRARQEKITSEITDMVTARMGVEL